jgi:mannosylglycerate hydrolase
MTQTKVFIFSHTHWDREWYRTFQEFRFGLVKAMDQILNLLQAKEYDYFVLDGQTVVLEDYLEIRPELKDALKKRVSSGNLVIGPWYVLPDEFLVSGESIVRNLLLGKKMSLEFGKYQEIGYLPDMFGHIAQMPQILRGFGIEKSVVWRGAAPNNCMFIWKGIDESEILANHLTEGYYNTFLINYENQKKDLGTHLEKLKAQSNSNIILFPNGGDHLAPPQEIKKIMKDLQTSFPEYKFIQSTIEEYFDNLRIKLDELEIISGELRNPERAYILPGVFSSRMYLKQQNVKLQNLLTDWVEPLSSLSRILGNEHHQNFINLAWKNLLQNQPHDSICGCSTDQVHREMIQRFDNTEQIAEKLINVYTKDIARSFNLEENKQYIIVYNASNTNYSSIFNYNLDFLKNEEVESFKLIDLSGNEIEYEILSKKDTKKFVSDIDVLPDWIEIRRFELALKIENIKPLGFKIIEIVKNENTSISNISNMLSTENCISNKFVKIEVKDNKLIATNLINNQVYELNKFSISGDAGDEYNYSPPKNDILKDAQLDKVEVIKNSLYSTSLKLEYILMYSEGLIDRENLSSNLVDNKIVSILTLNDNDPVIKVKTTIDNKSKDHKLTVSFNPLEQKDLLCTYDTQFGLLTKEAKANDRSFDMPKQKERIEETFAIQNFADLSSNKNGITIITKGLPEFEITERDNIKQLSCTLIRAVGWLSRDDLRTRGGGAGPAFETPEAQCLGLNEFEYGIYLHEKALLDSDSLLKVDQFNKIPRLIHYTHLDDNKIKLSEPIIKLNNKKLIVSTIKVSEDEDGIIFRFYNPMPYEQEYEIETSDEFSFYSAQLVRLDETVIQKLKENNFFSGKLRPYEIVSLKFITVHLGD